LELEGADPAWTSFYSDADCRKRLQGYRGSARNGGDPNVSKARLDFAPGVTKRQFFVLSKRIREDFPRIKVRLTGMPASQRQWARVLNLRFTTDDPMSSVAQNSLARAVQLGPDVLLNDPHVTNAINSARYDLSVAKLWRNQLVVHSDVSGRSPSRLALIDLQSQAVRQLRKPKWWILPLLRDRSLF